MTRCFSNSILFKVIGLCFISSSAFAFEDCFTFSNVAGANYQDGGYTTFIELTRIPTSGRTFIVESSYPENFDQSVLIFDYLVNLTDSDKAYPEQDGVEPFSLKESFINGSLVVKGEEDYKICSSNYTLKNNLAEIYFEEFRISKK